MNPDPIIHQFILIENDIHLTLQLVKHYRKHYERDKEIPEEDFAKVEKVFKMIAEANNILS